MTQKVNLFSAGSIATRYSEWKNLTNDTEVLSTVSGMPLDICDEEFSFENKPIEMKFSSKEESFLIKEIEKLLGKGVIRESLHEEGEFISPIFLVPKPPDSFRLILNLKKFNKFVPYVHFKMETINSILTMITPGCYMAKIDIKDAYYSIPILSEHQKY